MERSRRREDAIRSGGKLVDRVESVFLEPTDYSSPVAALAREGQLLELRRYVAAAGKRAALNARFREGEATWRRNGLACVAYLQPAERSADGEVSLSLSLSLLTSGPLDLSTSLSFNLSFSISLCQSLSRCLSQSLL